MRYIIYKVVQGWNNLSTYKSVKSMAQGDDLFMFLVGRISLFSAYIYVVVRGWIWRIVFLARLNM